MNYVQQYENRAKDLIISELQKDKDGYWGEPDYTRDATDYHYEPTVQDEIEKWVYNQLPKHEWFVDFYEAVKIYLSKTEAQNLWTEWMTKLS